MTISHLALGSASILLIALFCVALRGNVQPPRSARIPDRWIVKILSCCHCCNAIGLRSDGEHHCGDCGRTACNFHADRCAVCASVTCWDCAETWSGLDGVACRACARRVA